MEKLLVELDDFQNDESKENEHVMLERIQRELRHKGHTYDLETIAEFLVKGFTGNFCKINQDLVSFRQIINELEDERKKLEDQKIRASFKKLFTWDSSDEDDQAARDEDADETSRKTVPEKEVDESVETQAEVSAPR